MFIRFVMLAALIPLLFPSGVVVTVCLGSGVLGLRGASQEACACCPEPQPEEVAPCCRDCAEDAAESSPRGPCCIALMTLGEHPLKSTRDDVEAIPITLPVDVTTFDVVEAPSRRLDVALPAPLFEPPPGFSAPLLI